MAIRASLLGRLRNTDLPKSRPLLPLFEAVVNAIQAVDEAHADDMDSTRIEIRIIRDQQAPLEFGDDHQVPAIPEPIRSFIVTDNGEGFHDKNMEAFETLDTEHKSAYGGRGVGRLLWLKAFNKVDVVSHYLDAEGAMKERKFVFTAAGGVSGQSIRVSQASERGAEVRLVSFDEIYRLSAPKSTLPIAKSILEHCLWYFVRPGGAPNITIVDDFERVNLNSLFSEYMRTSSATESIVVKRQSFELVHLRLKAASKPVPQLNWCAARRVVNEESLSGLVPGLHGKLKDDDGEFMYACFLMSGYLDKHVRPERTAFDIPEVTEGALDEDSPSRSDIRQAALTAVEQYLGSSLAEIRQAGRERVERYVDRKAPRYRPILRHIDEDKLSVNPAIADKELELQLHRYLAELEVELLEEGQLVLESENVLVLGSENAEEQEYSKRLREYLEKVDDIKKSDLAAYVSRRRVILDLLGKAISIDAGGKYAKEEVVHSLIMPMRVTSDKVTFAASNLWIIDEGLAFHNYLASDKPISSMPITGSDSALEPDLLALKVHEGPVLVAEGERPPFASIVVVEIKRPMRKGASSGLDPLDQALRYLKRVREGKVRTAGGRPIPGSDQIPGFCHIIADLNPTLEERCQMYDLRRTQDGQGYFGYRENYKAYIEVSSFDRLLNMALQRNRAFFDSLGLPVS
jgi:hypothetical protein